MKRSSRSSIVILFVKTPIHVSDYCQGCISISLAEAEYLALAESGETFTWLRRIYQKLQTMYDGMELYHDYAGCIS